MKGNWQMYTKYDFLKIVRERSFTDFINETECIPSMIKFRKYFIIRRYSNPSLRSLGCKQETTGLIRLTFKKRVVCRWLLVNLTKIHLLIFFLRWNKDSPTHSEYINMASPINWECNH